MSEIMFSSDSVSKIIFQQLKIHECPCADPGIFVRGGPGQSDKKSSDNVLFIFFSPQLILQKSNGQFQRNLSLFKVPEGVQHFPGGSNFFQGVGGGSNCLFPIETHITCDFPGGGVWTPCPPRLDQHLMFTLVFNNIVLEWLENNSSKM